MSKLSECTPGPLSNIIEHKEGMPFAVCDKDGNEISSAKTKTEAELHALAYDHALLLAAIQRHLYEPISEPIGDRIERYVYVWTNLDEEQYDVFAEPELTPFGTPALTPSLRAALQRALGLDPTP